ncbi:galactokinase [Brachybacterium halotolerans subsp. kimchii]|uniref:Galactokinase n=1 Tax=Brachybacterium halotolerans TaxID=2795215 RepID=A0ABS1B9C1_9MICO|nr:galactokinase [Brachybacterium halotolerans]MBK0331254.1 galactokinase [Brachybacterium halotolerans]UEJ82283.1 galactokinase [Brachybacterium halotolerans subsp. kimchii]
MSSDAVILEAPDRGEAVDATARAFAAAYGYEPDGVWSAPGRVNIIGEHVDYQDGLCLPMAISHRCFVAAARTPTDLVRVRSAQSDVVFEGQAGDLAPGAVEGWPAYVTGVLWALRPFISGAVQQGVDIYLDGHVPFGSGLSSSASVECATAEALESLLSLGTTPLERVRACIAAENDFVGASTGGLDQSASVLAREGRALLLDCRDFSTTPVAWDLAGQGLALLITDTRAEHSHAGGEYVDRRRDSERAAEILGVGTLREIDPDGLDEALGRIDDEVVRRRARHVITEIQRVRDFHALLESGSVREGVAQLGALLNASHDSLRDDYEVTVPALDVSVDAARAAGAHGSRMTGGGFGGSTIALVEAGSAQDVAQAIADAFAREDLGSPAFFLALPEDGAGQDR